MSLSFNSYIFKIPLSYILLLKSSRKSLVMFFLHDQNTVIALNNLKKKIKELIL